MNTEKTGKYIAELRREKNLTQAQLADLLHVSDKAVSRWETGRGFPDVNSLEDIAAVLDTSVAELIHGERLLNEAAKNDVNEVTKDTLTLMKELLQRRKIQNLLTGFLISMIVLLFALVHISSPVYCTDPEELLQVETLSDGRIIAALSEPISGWELQHVKEDDEGRAYTFLSCYRTKLSTWTGRNTKPLILLGDAEETGHVYYYPGEEADVLLYPEGPNEGPYVVSLPRLVYNAWLLIGLGLSAICVLLCVAFRKTRYLGMAVKITAVPVSFVLSNILMLFGKRDQVYNASYYLSGILLMTILLVLLFICVYERRRKKHA